MKVLIDYRLPFSLAHGGMQVLIENTSQALSEIGVENEFLRWWDPHQRGEILHFFGRPTVSYLRLAHQRGLPVVMSELLSSTGSRPKHMLFAQKVIIALARRLLPSALTEPLAWDSYREADAILASTSWESHLVSYLFAVPPGKVRVVGNGVDEMFFNSQPVQREPWLLMTGRVTEVKRTIEVALAAAAAKVPLRIVGRPMQEGNSYFTRFLDVCNANEDYIRYEGYLSIEDLAKAYMAARGFVLLSEYESLSIAALEAAASGCPLLLSDLAWARAAFSQAATYCPVTPDVSVTSRHLRNFYDAAPRLAAPPKPATWREIAQELQAVYRELLPTRAALPKH